MFKNKKTVRISVDPSTIEKLSPEGVKAAVSRRIAKAPTDARKRTVNAFVAFMVALMLMFVAAFANTGQKADEAPVVHECPITVQTRIVWQGGMAPWDINDEDKATVMAAVNAVARGENQLTQQAVAQAIRNSCEDYDMTVSEVIAEFRWPTKCEEEVTDSVKGAVESVIDGYRAVNSDIHFAYNSAVQSGKWHETRNFVCQIGNLRFFA